MTCPICGANIEDTIMELPSFVHEFPENWQHGWEFGNHHSKQSGLHIEIDFFFDSLRTRFYWRLRHYPKLQKMLTAIVSFGFGVNCGFPLLDVIRFVKWEYEGYLSRNETNKRT